MLIAHFHLYKGHMGTTLLQSTILLQTTSGRRGEYLEGKTSILDFQKTSACCFLVFT